MKKEIIGVDLGGTNFKAGRVVDGEVVERHGHSVNSSMSESELLEILYETIASVYSEEISGIGIGVPGIVDAEEGIIYDIQNLPAWKEVPLRKILKDRFNVPIFLNNDANCFALGEHRFGKGQAFDNFIGLSIGTGLGMGVIINNRLYSGVNCGAGEIGMVPYKDGIVEHYAGSFFFQTNYKQSAKDIHEIAKRRQPQAIEAFETFGMHLGEAMKIILYAYAPEAFVLGGSISQAYPFFKEGMEKSLSGFAFQKQLEQLRIEISALPNVAILGAAALCLD